MEMVEIVVELPKEIVDQIREYASRLALEPEALMSLWIARCWHEVGCSDANRV